MADNIQASPQSPALAWIAEKLRNARSAGDTVTIPYLGGVGTMMLGKSPEEVTEWSYGNAPMQVPQMTRVPQFKAGRAESLADTLFAAQGAGSMARAAPATARALAPSAGALALEAAARTGMPVHGLGVVKPKGGNWLAGSVENVTENLNKAHIPDPELLRLARENGVAVNEEAVATNDALRKWIDTKLGKYIKNEMGSPEDPVRALAEKGRLHVDPDQLNFDINAYGKYPSDGQSFLAQNPAAKSWEGASDLHIGKMRADQLLEQGYADKNPWLAKVPPETPVNMMTDPREISSDLGFGHMIDELRNAVNPESGLPRELLWKYSDLDKVTVPQAVERVAAINEWRAAQQAEANAVRANNAAAALHKDYPDAPYKWVELKMPNTNDDLRHMVIQNEGKYSILEPEQKLSWKDPKYGRVLFDTPEQAMHTYQQHKNYSALEDALKYEGDTMGHCVGGYCPDVYEGSSRIFSLRNKKTGEPHVTIETSPSSTNSVRAMREGNPTDFDIVQIKGKANKAPKEEYLPFVQDFVKSGQWGRVGDINNTGLVDISAFPKRQEALGSRFVTEKELDNYLDSFGGEPKEGFADGGLVEPPLPAVEYSPLEVDYVIGNVTSGQHEPKYAEGGSVESTHIPYDEAKISSLVNALREELHA
jgi:hypothetical protein